MDNNPSGRRRARSNRNSKMRRIGPGAPVGAVEPGNRAAILRVERETEYVEVLRQALAPRRLRNRDQALVEMPAQDDLRRRALMLAGNAGDDRVGERRRAPER